MRKSLSSNLETSSFSSIFMVTQLERPDGNYVWNEMGYLEIVHQKKENSSHILFYMVKHVIPTWWKKTCGEEQEAHPSLGNM